MQTKILYFMMCSEVPCRFEAGLMDVLAIKRLLQLCYFIYNCVIRPIFRVQLPLSTRDERMREIRRVRWHSHSLPASARLCWPGNGWQWPAA